MRKRVALIITTGDRTAYTEYSIKCCLNLLNAFNSDTKVDIFLIAFDDVEIPSLSYHINYIPIKRPTITEIFGFPQSRQQREQYPDDLKRNFRVSFGHIILCSLIPAVINHYAAIFKCYDFILKSRAELVFGFDKKVIRLFNPNDSLLTFECFWGGCRYNNRFANDHFIFGAAGEVLDVIAYPADDCRLAEFWNPEEYCAYLYSKTGKKRMELTTDRYYLLSGTGKSRKWIDYPLAPVKNRDLRFLAKIGINIASLVFENPSG